MAKKPARNSLHDKWRMDSEDGGVRILKPAPKKQGKPAKKGLA